MENENEVEQVDERDKSRSYNQLFNTQDKYQAIRTAIQNATNTDPRVEGFTVRGGQLYSADGRMVVRPGQEMAVLEDEMDRNEAAVLGLGIKRFWWYMNQRYIGIKRKDVTHFLLEYNGTYQVARSQQPKKGKRYVVKSSNVLWCVDLADMQAFAPRRNYRYRYILVVVDAYSRRLWARAIRKKTATDHNTSLALQEIFDENNHVKPTSILTDRGSEWKSKFDELLARHRIHHLWTRSYVTENIQAERAIQSLRRILRAFAAQSGSRDWFPNLDLAVKQYNASLNSTLKTSPDKLYRQEKGHPTDPKVQKVVQQAERETARENRRESQLVVGQLVRVFMGSLFSEYRKKAKLGGQTKNMPIRFTPQLFSIRQVIPPRGTLGRWWYLLTDLQGGAMKDYEGRSRKFVWNELQASSVNAEVDMTMAQALRLNKIKRSSTDVNWEGDEEEEV
jgi:transposase InsO family protein